MSYVQSILQPDEQLLIDGRLHWIIYWPAIGFLILAAVAGGAGVHFKYTNYQLPLFIAAAILLICTLLSALRAWWFQFTTEIAVTSHRVIYKRGFITRHTDEMNIDKIESVIVEQSIPGRILGYGTIDIRGTGAGIERLSRVAHAIELRNAITSR
jgi:uncharacterized membrane protein YdbT with pleckstrin-like domain